MIRFKKYIVEYLTDEQRARYANVKMTHKARADTDHFFGPKNDIIHGNIDGTSAAHDKSEIHREVERHIGKQIPVDEYRTGLTADKYGRSVRIGRQIKDSKLRDMYATDAVREGSRKGSTFRTTTVRGTEVAGQTNSTPNAEHPKGHSWENLSCKNVDTGEMRNRLKGEIKHGTVVHRVHDHNGQEIYRATLQPHHNENGHVAYNVDSEYGIKNPAFTKSAVDTSLKLSHPTDREGLFAKSHHVYSDDGHVHMLHPALTPEDIHHRLSNGDETERVAAMRHRSVNNEHISKALDDASNAVRTAAVRHPNISSENLDKALDNKGYRIATEAAKHPNATPDHLLKAMGIPSRVAGVPSPESISAVSSPNMTHDLLHKALDHEDRGVRAWAVKNVNVGASHLARAFNDSETTVRNAAAESHHASAEQIHTALRDPEETVRMRAAGNPTANVDHLYTALNDPSPAVRRSAVANPNSTADMLEKGLSDKHSDVRRQARLQIKYHNRLAGGI